MLTRIRKIGNSKGVILPAEITRELDLQVGDDLDVVVVADKLVLYPGRDGESFGEILEEILADDDDLLEALAQ